MINTLVPLGGKSVFFDEQEYKFPKSLIEINGKPMIELVVENLSTIKEDKRFIFVVNSEECSRCHVDNILNLLTDNKCKIIQLRGQTRGAVCSVLMAIECINNNDKLLISNGDQIITEDMNRVLKDFEQRDLDAGVICFESVHPKWSYAKLDEHQRIIETAEKMPISKNAIAGWYYFKHGSDFIRSAMQSIRKGSELDGLYYIAPTMNELILENKHLGIYKINGKNYHSFYSPQKIKEFEKKIN